MQPAPPCSDPACWWQLQALGVAVRHIICAFCLFIYLSPPSPRHLGMLYSEIPKLPTDLPVRGSPGVWKLLSFLYSLPGMDFHPYLFCLSFYLLYFVQPPFEDNELPFWVPGVLCQRSEVVLWNLLGVQMFFR